MKIIDKYILKRYLVTFSVMLIMFIPIGITIDVSEKVNKMIEKKIPLKDILIYYGDFTIYFANLLFPIFLFLSVIWFTSKLANNTEIIAILSSGISFTRFMRPYIVGATIISVFALIMSIFLVPSASAGFKNFRYKYLIGNGQNEMRDNSDVFRQISKDEYLFVSGFNENSKMAFNFSMEKFDGDKLKYKLIYRVYIYFLVINLILFLIYCFGYLSDSFYLILFLLTLIQCYYLFRNNNVNGM